MTQPPKWKTAWITGASTGIGRELALQLAGLDVRVAASARSEERLIDLARLDSRITAYPVDVTDRAAMTAAARRIAETAGPIDLAILNAGVWHPMSARQFDAAKIAESISVNYLGIVNALDTLIPDMMARGQGQLGLVSSVAGYRGLPKSAAYAPSKAAVISLAEVLYPDLREKGVYLSVINPGFVDTPMTKANDFPMPFIIPADDAARRIIAGLERKKFEIAFPWQMVALFKMARVLPYPLYFWAARNFLAPPSKT